MQQPSTPLTTVTASLSSDSPNTTICSCSLTWISSNTARTATGSTAEIKLLNTRQGSKSILKPTTTEYVLSWWVDRNEEATHCKMQKIYITNMCLQGAMAWLVSPLYQTAFRPDVRSEGAWVSLLILFFEVCFVYSNCIPPQTKINTIVR